MHKSGACDSRCDHVLADGRCEIKMDEWFVRAGVWIGIEMRVVDSMRRLKPAARSPQLVCSETRCAGVETKTLCLVDPAALLRNAMGLGAHALTRIKCARPVLGRSLIDCRVHVLRHITHLERIKKPGAWPGFFVLAQLLWFTSRRHVRLRAGRRRSERHT